MLLKVAPLLNCHWYLRVGVPVAVTLKVVLAPAVTVGAGAGSLEMPGPTGVVLASAGITVAKAMAVARRRMVRRRTECMRERVVKMILKGPVAEESFAENKTANGEGGGFVCRRENQEFIRVV